MSFLDSLAWFFKALVAYPALTVILSVAVASCVIISVVLFNDRKLAKKIDGVTENRYFTLSLKTYYIGYDAVRDTLQVALLQTSNRKRIDIGVLKFFSKSSSFGKEFVLSALKLQLTDSNVQFSDESELHDILDEVGKWCDKIVRVEIKPSDLPQELDRSQEAIGWSQVNSRRQVQE